MIGCSVLVCHCYALTEADVRGAIADGAADELDVAAACGAGSCCGGCVPSVCRLLQECPRAAGAPLGAPRADAAVR